MLVEFSVANFRSFKDIQTLSFVAASIKSKYSNLDKENVFEATDKLKLLKAIGIYGANGSGKSNLVKAFSFFLMFVRKSFSNPKLGEWVEVYKNKFSDAPTFFQIILLIGGKKYRYGYEIVNGKIHSEWLFGLANKTETYYFTRDKQDIKINPEWFEEGKGLEANTSETNLFLNICAFNNKPIAKSLKDFLEYEIIINTGIDDNSIFLRVKKMLENDDIKNKIVDLISHADFGIRDIRKIRPVIGVEGDYLNDEANEDFSKIILTKEIILDNGSKREVDFDLQRDESEGTKKFLEYTGMIVDAINHGLILFLDEFDARLHPLLTKKIVQLFNSPKTNPKNAQLFFVTHDTNLLDLQLLRRDQIYFAEKNSKSESVIYSLADFKGIRNDASFEKDYIQGKYGAIPYLGGFKKLLES